MADIVFVAVVVAFFGLCVLYVRACDRLIGSTDEPNGDPNGDPTGAPEPEATGSAESDGREGRGPLEVVR
jgi:hypothetical protein